MHSQHQPLPVGPGFRATVHAQNMYPIRTTSSGNSNMPSTPSPTQPPTRNLPVPGQADNDDGNKSPRIVERANDESKPAMPEKSKERSQEPRRRTEESEKYEETNVEKTVRKHLDMVSTITTVGVAGSAMLGQGAIAAGRAIESKTRELVSDNPILTNLIEVADKLVDIGKVVPFIAPAFMLLKIIIDVEQKARDNDTKCNDMLERISFMVNNITVLERIKVTDPLKVVIEKVNETLKQAASLIQAYRKQGAIARRLNMSNSQNFIILAHKISECSQDLMLSLQIQQTGDISVLSRSVPVDPQDKEAENFVASHGGQSAINNNPQLVEEFAKKMHLTMSDQVMEQMQSSMEDLLEENQFRIEAMLKEGSTSAVAETIKALASEVRELEAEQRLTCLQCDKEYRESANGPEACSFHKSSERNGSYSCCGKKAPCTFSNHRSVHHCDYPYTSFYDYAFGILGYSDTVDDWTTVEEKDMLTSNVQRARIGRLVRWRSYHEKITKPMMFIHIGRINYDSPYYFEVFDAEDIKKANAKARETDRTLIFRTSKDDSQYAMAEWMLDDSGVINGLKLSTKVATSDTATVKVAPIDIATVSLSGDIKTLSKSAFRTYKPAEPYNFPETRHVGYIQRTTPLREVREFKAKTKLPVVIIPQGKMEANSQGRFIRNNADKFQNTLRIFNKAPPTSQTYVTLASCKAEYRFVGEKEYKAVETLDLGDVKFPAAIGPTQSLDIPVEAIVPRNEVQAALRQNCWHWAMVALHHPVRIRLTFEDIEGEECVLVQEYIHKPNRMAVKNPNDLLFLHIDDDVDGDRSSVRVTKESEEPDNVIDVNGTKYSVEDLNTIVYKAEKSGESEVQLNIGRESDSNKWAAWALIDFSCRRVYGFKLLLIEGTGRDKKTTAAMGYAACPIYGEEDQEGRPIQYAEEKVTFPELEPAEPVEVVVDDDVDDEKAVVEPAIALAAEVSSSVTAALTEVSRATSSLDSAVFLSSMASLDKRLESLDTNVARMATALEKLVEILRRGIPE
ncbi:hypothetical protein BGZ65_002008 [Modicella reniformis]|uniref:Uncharacterized protein n=1 Tax=Modicella reniformis TaxID=1440133 RepID=A0A9P6SQK1_9FUNG|nr:hypothetical protein BGZ65_002008 [Modicella reniformis]